jgi:GDP-4-dehydro-6-deoxy-D-mannose reductase
LTGGGGFVGGYLAPLLAQAAPGARKVVLSREAAHLPGWKLAQCDIADAAAVETIVNDARPDLVVHLAAQSSVGASHDASEATWRVNFGGSLALATACARVTPEATVLFASSAEVYGASFGDGVVDEDAPVRPQNAYARSKAAAELMFEDVLSPRNTLIVTRAFNHTGPGQSEQFALPSFAMQIARMEAGVQPARMLVGNLDAERDFLDVRDVCDAYLDLIAAAPRLGQRSVFNIASGSGHSIGALLERLRDLSTVTFSVEQDSALLRPSDTPRALGRSDRLQAATGWRPSRTIDAMLSDLLDHARQAITAA